MSETDESYGLLSQTSSIAETRSERWQRHLPTAIGLHWLRAGWQDLTNQPVPSLAYGLGVYLVSIALVWLLAYFGRDYILFPALSGFMPVAPVLAIGPYEQSRAPAQGERVQSGRAASRGSSG